MLKFYVYFATVFFKAEKINMQFKEEKRKETTNESSHIGTDNKQQPPFLPTGQ